MTYQIIEDHSRVTIPLVGYLVILRVAWLWRLEHIPAVVYYTNYIFKMFSHNNSMRVNNWYQFVEHEHP